MGGLFVGQESFRGGSHVRSIVRQAGVSSTQVVSGQLPEAQLAVLQPSRVETIVDAQAIMLLSSQAYKDLAVFLRQGSCYQDDTAVLHLHCLDRIADQQRATELADLGAVMGKHLALVR